MKLALEHARDAAELVFDGAGEAGQTVSLELGERDNTVGRQNAGRDGELLDQLSLREGDGLPPGEIGQGDSQLLSHLYQAGPPGSHPRPPKAWRVAVSELRSGRSQNLSDSPKDSRVGGDRFFWRTPDEQVGLEQDLFVRPDKAFRAAQQGQPAADGLMDNFLVVTFATDQGNLAGFSF